MTCNPTLHGGLSNFHSICCCTTNLFVARFSTECSFSQVHARKVATGCSDISDAIVGGGAGKDIANSPTRKTSEHPEATSNGKTLDYEVNVSGMCSTCDEPLCFGPRTAEFAMLS